MPTVGAARLPVRLAEWKPPVTNIDTRSWCGGSVDGGRRVPAESVPPGADPGEEDGEGADLLAGDLRLHQHQCDPDPSRPLRLREVRQARSRLQCRQPARRDPEDPADA